MGMAIQSTAEPVPVLLTRPEAQSRVFAALLAARFGAAVRPVLTPLMAPVFLTPEMPAREFSAVIFTSATAVEAVAHLAGSLPRLAYCVGRQTAARAAAAGFRAFSADGNADRLVALILAEPPGGRLLHLRGELARGAVAERLNTAGIETVSVVVYRQDPLPLSAEAQLVLAMPAIVIAPLFSPRSAELLRQALPRGFAASLRLAAMSVAVAEAAEGIAWDRVELARRMDAEAMVEAVGRLLVPAPAP